MARTFLSRRIPSFWTIQLTGWIVYFVVIYVTFLTIAPPENFGTLLVFKAFRAFTGLLLTSLFLRPIYKFYEGRLSIAGLITLAVVCSVIFGVAWTAIEGVFAFITSTAFDAPNYLARGPRIALDYSITLTAWSALYLGVKNWISWQSESERSLQSSALAKTAQLEMLRYQLNPHFLFNALNSIRASIDEDSTQAKRMITQLSEFLRYSLLAESKKIPLSEELEAVRNYLAIEKIRFEDKLSVEFDIEKNAENFQIPNFLLNPLVENAVKHGMQTSRKPLEIKISAGLDDRRFVLEVSNTGALNGDTNGKAAGIGLKNVRERLRTLFGDDAMFEIKQDELFVKARIEISDETQSDHR